MEKAWREPGLSVSKDIRRGERRGWLRMWRSVPHPYNGMPQAKVRFDPTC
jgi:hypothetical protein